MHERSTRAQRTPREQFVRIATRSAPYLAAAPAVAAIGSPHPVGLLGTSALWLMSAFGLIGVLRRLDAS